MGVEQTYTAIKPDAFDKQDEIIIRIHNAGFDIVKQKELTLSKEEAEKFYEEHKGKDFFNPLIDFITSGPIVAMVLEKENCVNEFRTFIGNTDPAKAEKGTIRSDYGGDLPRNAIHASDSLESAEREINLIFG